ncbi:MAG: hypothetical protein QXI84_07690 [Thermofilaceae archaeon]
MEEKDPMMQKVAAESSVKEQKQSDDGIYSAIDLKNRIYPEKWMEENGAMLKNPHDGAFKDLVIGIHAARKLVEEAEKDPIPELTYVLIFRLLHQAFVKSATENNNDQ